jgi:dUTP pyrophosphatase
MAAGTNTYRLELVVSDTTLPYVSGDLGKENAGFDVHCASDVAVGDKKPVLLPLGVRARLIRESDETDCHYWLLPRSSIFKAGFIMANSVGVIDASYRGELKAPVVSLDGEVFARAGERYFQIVAPDMGWIRRVDIVGSLPDTVRGAGGFGSTGK